VAATETISVIVVLIIVCLPIFRFSQVSGTFHIKKLSADTHYAVNRCKSVSSNFTRESRTLKYAQKLVTALITRRFEIA